MTPETYDLESVYDDEIAPLMTEIIAISKRVGMPMFASFAYRNDDEVWSTCDTLLHHDHPKGREAYAAALAAIRRRPDFAAFTVIGGAG
jgi:hypothetical protein